MPMEFINQNILLISVVVVSGIGLIWSSVMRAGNAVSPTQLTQLINRENPQIIDVREADEFSRGHIADSLHIPASKLVERVVELAAYKETPLVVCCASGMRSARACAELKKHGFNRIYNLAGGVDAWVGAGLPIKKGTRGK